MFEVLFGGGRTGLVELAWIASSFGRCLLGLKRGGRILLVCTGTWCSGSTCWALPLPVEDSSAAGSGRGGKTAQGSSLAAHRDDILLALHVKAKIAVHIYERWHQYTSQVVFEYGIDRLTILHIDETLSSLSCNRLSLSFLLVPARP